MTAAVLESVTGDETLLTVKTAHLITEDDNPVDNLFSEKQQRLLTEPIYTSWSGPGTVAVSGDCQCRSLHGQSKSRYCAGCASQFRCSDARRLVEHGGAVIRRWQTGKTPYLVVEIVSNTKGNELDEKYRRYEQMRVPIYVVLDPEQQIQDETLAVYLLNGFGDHQMETATIYRFPEIGLGLTLWDGEFEGARPPGCGGLIRRVA